MFIFKILCKPVRVYKALLIFVSTVILYAIVYNEEFSESVSGTEDHKVAFVYSGREYRELKRYNENHKSNPPIQKTKYILLWTPNITPLNKIQGSGREPFFSSKCEYRNCYITRRRKYFADQTKFDAIVFSIAALNHLENLPKNRSSSQKYVAASTEPPETYPVINPMFDAFFNWTWTYRLDSDILWRKFRILDSKRNDIGPKKDINWPEEYTPEDTTILYLDDIGLAIGPKSKAVMWIKTCCKCKSASYNEQLKYIIELEMELNNYGLALDTYSNCNGYNTCGDIVKCKNLVKKDYYFYLAFEDYVDKDYVTDTLLFAVQNLAVPVVIGNTNYSRFLPPGSYLDAKQLNASALAAVIDDSIGDFISYEKYFRWVHHYKYESISIKSEICHICSALNNRQMVNNYTLYNDFRKMWNGEESALVSDFLINVLKYNNSLKNIAYNGNYSEIRKIFRKKHFPDPRDSVYVFDMDGLNLTSTEETNVIPYELTTVTTNE